MLPYIFFALCALILIVGIIPLQVALLNSGDGKRTGIIIGVLTVIGAVGVAALLIALSAFQGLSGKL